MLTTQITAPGARPLSVLAEVDYREVDKDTVDALGRSASTALRGPVRADRSVYEFPGDRTYDRYLATKAAV